MSNQKAEHPLHKGFYAVKILKGQFLNPAPEHEGERVLWADGSAHSFPEFDEEYVTVLRRL